MLTAIEVWSSGLGTTLRLPIEVDEDPLQRNNYFVQDVVGIDPVQALISSGEYAHADGSYFKQSRLDVRNIVLTLGMNPDHAERTVQNLRENLYKYLMPKVEVRLNFEDDSRSTRTITGIVESLEFPIFTSDPVASISILCLNPNFSSAEESIQTFSTTALSQRDPLVYDGTVPTGVSVKIQPRVSMTNVRFEIEPEGGGVQTFHFKGEILPNRILSIDTTFGQRKADITYGGMIVPALHWVSLDSSWPQLYPGTNLVRFYAVASEQEYSIFYREQFGGL